jgi:hypothetical protein
MAEVTLKDVAKQLKTGTTATLDTLDDQTVVLKSINDRFNVFFDILEKERKERLEDKREDQQDRQKAEREDRSSGGMGEQIDSILNWLRGSLLGAALVQLATTIAAVAAAFSSLLLAANGLGPTFKDLDKFIKTITRPQRAVTAWAGRVTRGPRATLAGEIMERYNKFRTEILRRIGIGVDGKPVVGRGAGGRYEAKPIGKALINLNTNFNKFMKFIQPALKPFQEIGRYLSGSGSRVFTFLGDFAKNKYVTGFFRFLRPLAAILSIFDGFSNAAEEMEDREGFFNKYLGGGLGGFVSGSLGSFFGEFFNLIKDLPLFAIKYFFPDMVDEEGNFKRDTFVGNILANIQKMDFNKLITDLIQAPFDALGRFVDHTVGFFSGDAEDKAKARKYFDELFSLRGLTGLFDLVFSPINAIIGLVMDLFKKEGDKSNTETTLSEKISQLFSYLTELIPSGEDIQRMIRSLPGGAALLDMLGFTESQADAVNRTEEQVAKLQQRLLEQQQNLALSRSLIDEYTDNNLTALARRVSRHATQTESNIERTLKELEKARLEAEQAKNANVNVGGTNIQLNGGTTQAAVISTDDFLSSVDPLAIPGF